MKASRLGWLLVGYMACGDQRLENVRPQLLAPPATLDFGALPVFNRKSLDLELVNQGRAGLVITSVDVVSENSIFTLDERPETVAPGDTAVVKLSFVPTAEKDYEATLTVTSDDLDLPTVTVKLTGKGSTRAVMEIEPESIEFGRVGECGSSLKTLTVRSKGTADLVIEDLSFVEGSSPHFSFIGSTRTPVVVKTVGANGLPGEILLTLRYSVPEGATEAASATLRLRSTDPDQREVLIPISGTPNRAPVARIAPLGNAVLGQDIALDGAASSDVDGDEPLSFAWTLRQKPLGATTQLSSKDAATSSMRLDDTLPGTYEVELTVTDSTGVKSCRPARANVVGAPAQKLLIEMFWNNARTDMDLHFFKSPSVVFGTLPDDCHYANPKPDWGILGDDTDNPEFIRDALTGYGPEVVGYVNPVDGTYRIVVEHSRANLAPDPETEITVRIYQYGVVKAELKKTLLNQGDVWGVADVEWPSGTVTPLP